MTEPKADVFDKLSRASAHDALSLKRVRPAYEQVAEQLRQLILDGELKAGDRLPSEANLLTIFGVSRSTLREALRVLAARDLVHTLRGVAGGTFVSEVDPVKVSSYLETSLGLMSGTDVLSVKDIIEARESIEVPSARFAAKRASESQVSALRQATLREVDNRGQVRRFQEHKAFHSIVVEATGNPLLIMMNEPNFRLLQTRFRRTSMPDAYWQQVEHDHVEITERIAAHDIDGAGEAMFEHLARLRDLYLPVVE